MGKRVRKNEKMEFHERIRLSEMMRAHTENGALNVSDEQMAEIFNGSSPVREISKQAVGYMRRLLGIQSNRRSDYFADQRIDKKQTEKAIKKLTQAVNILSKQVSHKRRETVHGVA